MKKPKHKYKSFEGKPEKSWSELGIPSDRVAPGAPNPPPAMGDVLGPKPIKKKPKMRHGAY
jgi:hypothetical protein